MLMTMQAAMVMEMAVMVVAMAVVVEVAAVVVAIAAMVASDLHRRQSPRPRRLPTTLEVLDALTHLSDKEALGVPVTLENPLYQRVSVMSGRL